MDSVKTENNTGLKHLKTAVIVPSYKVSNSLPILLEKIPEENVDYIIVVDDKCPENSGLCAEKANRRNCIVIYHKKNQGVGGAVISGYLKALDLGCDIIIKMDGDGQMDPSDLGKFIRQIADGRADYVKGNRFYDITALKTMPKIRLFGNSILSFIIKLVSGYWRIMDPTNGYTAIHRNVLRKIDLSKIAKGYFFEINMLIELNIAGARVKDISIPAKYNNRNSSLSITKVIAGFPIKLIKGFLKRIFLEYYIYEFNMGSVYILLGVPLFLFGIIFGAKEWMKSMITGQARPLGTIVLIALLIIVSSQMLLQAIRIDINKISAEDQP